MNNEIDTFTTEFFDHEARKRKQIPIAVFTIIAVHVILFLGLLGAAGCKKETKATASDTPKVAEKDNVSPKPSPANKTQVIPEAETTEAAEMARREKPAQPVIVKPSTPLKGGEKLAASKPVTATEPAASVGPTVYTVKAGDSLAKIAAFYKTTPKAIKTQNALKSDVIRVGQKLKINSGTALAAK